ncbi:MAG TPA: D-alanyl-D-alanine carboxypeptidase/D-alanyl-D-alanine-endopeptidase, partial [Steroidobacteraceae bacterium]
PYMTIERWWSFVREIRELGIERIKGDLVIDNTYFAPVAGSRGDFDRQPHRSYNVLPDALLVNFQTSRFTVVPEPAAGRPRIVVNPLPANLRIENRTRLGRGRCRGQNRSVIFAAPDETASEIVVAGTIAPTCGRYSATRAIMSAPEFAYGTFRTLWTESGGTIDGGLRLAKRPIDSRHFHTFGSVPLSEVIRLINKYSNNVMARHLLLTLGAEKFGPPATPESGADAVTSWLESRRIEIPGLFIENGSGLSRKERITARGLGEVLQAAWYSPYMPEFAASLPLSAMDGTLRNRFAGMEGRLRLKTGRIDDVSALAGFVYGASGKTYVLAVIINHPQAHFGVGEGVQTELVRWAASQ